MNTVRKGVERLSDDVENDLNSGSSEPAGKQRQRKEMARQLHQQTLILAVVAVVRL
jgi:hypothetical protein